MSEVIVKLTGDHIKVKGGEYVRDIVRCNECKRSEASLNDGCVYCTQLMWTMNPDDFCSYGEPKGADDE